MKLLLTLANAKFERMVKLFEVLILEEAFEFLNGLERKHYEKILYNIRKAQVDRDPELLKKLSEDIWEFRTLYQGLHYRLLAFWDKTSNSETLVISTHGFVKKRSKVPDKEIQKAMSIRSKYYANKQLKNKKL
jgi:hypothetical protein